MASEVEVIGWINIYLYGGMYIAGLIYGSYDEAMENKNMHSSYVATTEIRFIEKI